MSLQNKFSIRWRLVEFVVEFARRGAVFPRRDDGGLAGFGQAPQHPLVGIIGLIGEQQIGGHLRQQGIAAGEIMYLSGG